jgi:hypothetical protein
MAFVLTLTPISLSLSLDIASLMTTNEGSAPGSHLASPHACFETILQVWRQQLQSRSYAFQVPLDIFGGMVGVVCVHCLGEKHCMNSLWRHFFTVQGQLDCPFVH